MRKQKMNYFIDCQTVEQVKQVYRKLAFQYHPDHGGSTEEMQKLNDCYEKALKRCDGQKTTDSEGVEHTYYYNQETEEAIINAIARLLEIKMIDCDILLIGTWLWITGATKPYKEQLKAIGCLWHSKRGCWYFRSAQQKRWSQSSGDLGELAAKYGCTKIEDLEKKESRKKAKAIR
jgi:hypothetical protein